MKRLVIGAAVAGGAAFAFRRLARQGRKMRDRCHEMMRDHCSTLHSSSHGCRLAQSRNGQLKWRFGVCVRAVAPPARNT